MAAASSSLGTQFREELSCGICLELFTTPKVLPCQHTFCQDCLEGHAGWEETFQCPNCRWHVILPPEGVAGLPDNHLVTSLCERLQNQATLSEETRESGNRCSFHPSEEVKLYCKQCNMPVCNECLDEIHSNHRTITLKKASEERRAPVQALIVEGRTILETYCTSLRSLRDREKALDEKKQELDNSIIQTYEQEVQKVTEKKDHLLLQVEEKYKDEKEALQEERDRVLADVNELSAACDRAEHEMEQGGVESLGQEAILTGVVGKYRGKAAPTPAQTQPAVVQPSDTVRTVAWLLLFAALLLYSPSYWVYNATFEQQSVPKTVPKTVPRTVPKTVPKTITFGGFGTGQFNLPSGVAVSDEGEIFVADRLNQRVQVFTLQGEDLDQQFPTVVSGEQKMCPYDVALDGEGNLWVVGDRHSADVALQYNKQGRVLKEFNLQETLWDRGVAVDTRRNHILIIQTNGNWSNPQGEVQVFRPDGTLVRTVGQQQGMKVPRYITVDGEGNILVSDWDNDSVYVYNEDGQFLFQFGGEGSGEGQLKYPRGICTDGEGNIIVADRGNSRVEMFDKTGKFLKHITTDMKKPQAVAMATQGQLVVTDLSENSVHIIHSY
ncbi:PREDICTED: tripartite motif-containing protein 2-like [Branchiostoma belcheri]|uniref:RING-type E3 ubiquitin transferase n=1 Tax=Branchiostoma belcheri TaxID=7741 RepID=A0A6P4ZG59_BRABE|nr:PREDICTED: tripartite motif-containing protein 2-like [Branchiostoma belcheri]